MTTLENIEAAQLNDLLNLIATVLEVPADALDANSDYESVEGWDSMKIVALAVALEGKYQVAFDPSEVVEMISVRKIVESLSGHSVL